MSHHTEDESFKMPNADELFKQLGLKSQPKTPGDIGATGKYPDGKMSDNDEGGIKFRIAVIDKVVTIDFGKPVHSIGFTRDEAIALANHLFETARTI